MNQQQRIRIADKVDMNNLTPIKQIRRKGCRAIVSYSKSTKTLFFNSKMVALLDMDKWEDVLMCYDNKTRVIVLKHSDPEEVGTVAVRKKKPDSHLKPLGPGEKIPRIIFAGHVADALGITETCYFRGEREGAMIFLEMEK